MNGLTVSELCCLFCCPPCPSQIVAKLAFLPPAPTYKLIISGDQTIYPAPQSNNLNEQTNLNQQQQNNSTGVSTPTGNGARNNRNNNGGSNFMNMIRNSTRNLCSNFVCAQRYSPQNNGQLCQQLHTNAKLQLTEKAEW